MHELLWLTVLMPWFASMCILNDTSVKRERHFGRYELFKKPVAFVCVSVTEILVFMLAVKGLFGTFDISSTINNYQDIVLLIKTVAVCTIFFLPVAVVYRIVILGYYSGHSLKIGKKAAMLSVLFIVLGITPLYFAYVYANDGMQMISISEVCRKKEVSEDSAVSYVVLKNTGTLNNESVMLYLSDKEDDLKKLCLGEISIAKGAEITYEVDSDETEIFKKKGGEIFLSDKFGHILESISVPALEKDYSYVLADDNVWNKIYIGEGIVEDKVPVKTSFSAPGGFYDEAFYIELTAEEGTTIYYTLDGSNPNTDSIKYTEPLYIYNRSSEENVYRAVKNVCADYLSTWVDPGNVAKATVVRAVAVDSDGIASDIATETYFVELPEYYRNTTVLSLVMDPEDLFGENGIYITGAEYDTEYMKLVEEFGEDVETDNTLINKANFYKRGDEWERTANAEIYSANDKMLNQTVGAKIQGAMHRRFQRKRFSIIARNRYNNSPYFEGGLFDGDVHSIQTREGNVNALCMQLFTDRGVAYQRCHKTRLFLNGEYWSTGFLIEKYSSYYFSSHYGISRNNLSVVKGGKPDEYAEEGDNPYSRITKYLSLDMRDDDNYEKLCKILDIQNYIDLSCVNLYMDNVDTREMGANTYMWHAIIPENDKEGDTRWRFALYDLDCCWGNVLDESIASSHEYEKTNTYTVIRKNGYTAQDNVIYSSLKNNSQFVRDFVVTMMDLINTDFKMEHVLKVQEEHGITLTEKETQFFENRAPYMIQYTIEEFNLKGNVENICLFSNVTDSNIKLNTMYPDMSQGLWQGQYITDFTINLSAEEGDGKHFVEWQIGHVENIDGKITFCKEYSVQDKNIETEVKEGLAIYALFE